MSETSVIEAAAMRCRTMADGSLRIECEVEPRNAQAAFALFGQPGAPMALARLKVGAAAEAKSDEVEPAEEAKRDKPIARWLALRCREPEFQRWLARALPSFWCDLAPTAEECAAETVRLACAVESRGDIDGNPEAEAAFRGRIQGPWQKHNLARTA